MGKLFAPNAPQLSVPVTEPRKSLSLREKVILSSVIAISVIAIASISYYFTASYFKSKINKQEVTNTTLINNPFHDIITGLSNNLSILELEKRTLLNSQWSIARNKKMKELDIQIIETIIETDKVSQLSSQIKTNIEATRISILDDLKSKNLYPF